jgi:RNA polymerase sigma-70 factor, ECF subfamily
VGASDDEPMGTFALDPRALMAEPHMLHRLQRRVRSVARAVLRDQSDAEDAAQDALLLIVASAGSYRGESSVETWAGHVAFRSVLRARRRARLRRRMLCSEEACEQTAHSDQAGELLARHLGEYLGALEEERGQVLVLRHVLDYSIDEIASITGAPRNTVKDRLRRARDELRRMVKRDWLCVGQRML